MTRINSAIPPKCLTDEHLIAEHREIKRMPYCLRRAIISGGIKRIPKKFTLGTGHVLFFIDKQKFIFNRYLRIRDEVKKRGFDAMDFSDNWHSLCYGDYWNDYMPTDEERGLLVERITERINNSKKLYWHYFGMPISKGQAIELLWK